MVATPAWRPWMMNRGCGAVKPKRQRSHHRAMRFRRNRIFTRFRENDLVQCERVGDEGIVDAAYGAAFMFEDVVADGELPFEQIDLHFASHAPEITFDDCFIDEPDNLARSSETHEAPPSGDHRMQPVRRRDRTAHVDVISVTRRRVDFSTPWFRRSRP